MAITDGNGDLVPSKNPASISAANWGAVRAAMNLFRDASEWGVTYDSSVDSSTEAQAAIDANKGGFLVFSKDFMAKDLKMDDSTYNGTTIIMEGRMYLAGNGSANTPGLAVPAGLYIGPVADVTLHFRGHGNRLNMTVREQISLLVLAGCTNLNIPEFDAVECRGDGVYMTHTGSGSLGDYCDGVHFGRFRAVNSATDGRNGLTIITGKNIVVDDYYSNRFGHLVGGGSMPGGIDIEPNNLYELVENVQIGKAFIRTVGTAGFAVHGQSSKLTVNVTCANLVIENYVDPFIDDQNSNTTQASTTRLIRVANARQVKISAVGRFINAYGVGLEIQGSDDCNIALQATKVHYGLYAGGVAVYGGAKDCDRCRLDVVATDVSRYGAYVANLFDCVVAGTVSDPKTAFYTNRFGVYCAETLTRTRFEMGVEYSADWTRAYRNAAATYTSVVLNGVDLSAFTTVNNRVDDTVMKRTNSPGASDGTAQPNDGSWVQGQFYQDTASSKTANGNIRTGWLRLTTGAANVAGTDWEPVYQPTTDVSHA